MTEKILLLENNKDTYARIHTLLTEAGYTEGQIIHTTGCGNLEQYADDNLYAILADISNCCLSKETCFSQVKEAFPYTPVIILTETEDMDTAVLALKQGAQDCLVKSELTATLLKRTLTYACERKKVANNYLRLFTESPMPAYIYDVASMGFIAVNTAALKQYGYSMEEMLQMNALDIRPQEDRERFREVISNLPQTYFDAGVWRHIRKGGSLFHVHVYAHSTVFEGKPAAMVLAIDVETKIRAEAEAEKKSKQLERVWESITDGLYVLNNNWEFTYVNKESERILEHTKEELIGHNIWEIFPEAVNLKFYSEYTRAVRDNVSVHFEEYFAPFDLWVSVNAYPTSEGLVAYVLDITEQKETMERIQNEREKLRAIINNTPDIIWSIDRELNIVDANQPFWDRIYLMTGKMQDELTQTDFSAQLMASWAEFLQPAFEGKTYKRIIEEQVNGKLAYEEISFNPIYDTDREIVGVSCFSRDITEEREYQNMIELQNKQLKEIAWLQSHKVRNQVATIQGLAQLFNHTHPQDPVNQEILNGIKQTSDELDAVIREINDKTRDIGN